MIKLELLGVSEGPSHPVVLLRNGNQVLPIVVGFPEAHAIQLGLLQEKFGRPLTHDLICNVLAGLRGELQSVTIYKLENETFFAHLNVEQKSIDGKVEQVLRIDTRPSDGIALATRTSCPIYAAEEVMDMAAQDISVLNSQEENEEDSEEEPEFPE